MNKTIFTTKKEEKKGETIFTTGVSPKKENQKIYSTKEFPKAIGPYSPSVKAGKTFYFSGQIAIDPQTGKIVKGGIKKETIQVIKNISGLLAYNKLTFENIVKTTIFLKNMDDFKEVNDIYGEYFSHKPARSTVEVSNLPMGALIEIEVIARK